MRAAAPAPLGVGGPPPKQLRRPGSSRNITRPATGRPSHVQATAWGRFQGPVLTKRPLRGAWCVPGPGFVLRPTTEKEDDTT